MQKEIVSGICLETRTATFFTLDADVDGSYYTCVNCHTVAGPLYHVANPSNELIRQLMDYWYGDRSDLVGSDILEDEDEEWRCYDLH